MTSSVDRSRAGALWARSFSQEAAILAVALLCALAAGSLLMLAWGASPAQVWGVMLARSWGDLFGVGQVLFRATPLIFTGLAVSLAFHAGLFNIGAEGQLVVGSFVTAYVGVYMSPAWPALLVVPACLLAGALAAACLGALAGWLKVRLGAHEVLSTIMLNFIAQALVLWLGHFVFVEQTLRTSEVAWSARLRTLGLGGSAASFAFVIALAAALALAGLLWRTRVGFELRVIGHNAAAAEAGGIFVGRRLIWVMGVSGALAGLVGAGTVLGDKGYYEYGVGSGAGFMGIAVALLARNHPLAIVGSALFFATLSQGGLAANALVPKEIAEVLLAIVIVVVAITSAEFRRRWPVHHAHGAPARDALAGDQDAS